MQNIKYYILANGEGTRWNNYKGVPKQLIEIDGETILNRMVRLLHENGVPKDHIIICGPFTAPESESIFTKSPTKREVFEEIAELAQGPFAILYGDCYYTEEFMRDFTTRPINKFDEYLCTTGNPNTGCPWCEGYGHRCVDWEWWLNEMRELNNNKDKISLYKDWYIHFWLLGFKFDSLMNRFPKPNEYDKDHDVKWCDQTDDFDYPGDLDKFCEVTGHKCTNKEVKNGK